MFNIFPPLLIIIGIAGLIFIFKRQKEKIIVAEARKEEIFNQRRKLAERFRRILNRENYQKACNRFFALSEKFLIRSRIIILRVDRTIFKNLTKIRGRKNNGGEEEKKNGIIQSFSEKKLIDQDIDSPHVLNSREEEIRLLKKLENNPEDMAILKNLARIYLWQKQFSSACWILLQAYRMDKEDNVVQDLLIELYEKRSGNLQSEA